MISVVEEVNSEGLQTIVQPAARMNGTRSAEDEEGEIPRRDQADDADRLASDQSEHLVAKIVEGLAMQHPRRAGGIFVDVGGALDFAARLADRLAGLQRFEQRQFVDARADALRGLQQNGGALDAEDCPDQRRSSKASRATLTAWSTSALVQSAMVVTGMSWPGLRRSSVFALAGSYPCAVDKEAESARLRGQRRVWTADVHGGLQWLWLFDDEQLGAVHGDGDGGNEYEAEDDLLGEDATRP